MLLYTILKQMWPTKSKFEATQGRKWVAFVDINWRLKSHLTVFLKGQCHEIFELYFFSVIKPIWALDKQAKMVFLKDSFSRRYSNKKFEKFDSARSRNISTS